MLVLCRGNSYRSRVGWALMESKPSFRFVCAAALIFGVAVGIYANRTGFLVTHDDAHITFRYAAHAITGRGLVFNPGERVWGFTSPLQTLLLTVLGSLGLDIPPLSLALALLWISLTSCILLRVARHFFAANLPAAMVALFALTYGAGYSYLGLETNLLIFLEVLFLFLILEGRVRWAAGIGSLACLARPDAIILVGPVLLMTREGRRPASIGIFLAPGALWLAFAWNYYGDILPNTFHAKRDITPLATFLVEVGRWLTDPFGSADSPVRGPYPVWHRLGAWLLLLASLLPLLNSRLRERRAFLYALVLYPWALIFAYGLVGAPVAHRWEYFAAFFFLRVAAVVGVLSLPGILSAIPLPFGAAAAARRWLTAVVAAPLALLIVGNARDCFGRLDRERQDLWYGKRYRDLSAVARYIDATLPRGETLLLLEVGVVGYLTEMQVIDMAGLTTRGYRPANVYDYRAYLAHYRPRYALLYGGVGSLQVGDLRYRAVYFLPGEYATMSLLARED